MSVVTSSSVPSSALRQDTAARLAAADLRVTLPWQALAVTGPDAATFLQGQATTDIREVSAEVSRLGCLLNLKGRVQASFRLVAIDDGFLLVLPADQLAAAQTRLAKYAVFSKVTLAASPLRITGVFGEQALAALTADGWTLPSDQGVSRRGDDRLVRLPGVARALLISGAATDAASDEASLAAWDCAAIAAGEYLVPAAASEQHQPQEIDYHTLLGVSYQKGCYLGQEIVARLYFRGQLKSALCRLQADWTDDLGAAPAIGQSVLSGTQNVGEVLAVAWPAPDRVELLTILRLDAEAPQIDLDGTRLSLQRSDFLR